MIALLRLALVAALTIGLGPSVAAETPLSVRVVAPLTDVSGEVYYAQEKGFFKRAGLDVDVIQMDPPNIPPAVASGTVDIGHTPVATLAAAREHGGPFVMIAPSSIFSIKLRPTAGIVVAKNSPIKTARDFNGKTVAVNGLLGIAQVSVDAWIDKNGGDSSTVKYVELTFAAMIPALETGRVDAIELGEPVLDEVLARGHRSLSSGYEAIADEFVVGAWFCTSSFATAHPDVVRRFANAMAETARWANAHQAESRLILAKWTKLTVAPTMPRVVYGEHLNPALMQPLIDAAAKYHALKASMPAADLLAPGIGGK